MTAPRALAGRTLSSILLFLFAALPVAGQGSMDASGDIRPASFWWDLSLGSGFLQVSCDICDGEWNNGGFAQGAVGAYATPRLAVGIEFGGWTHLDGEIRERVLQAAVTARWARDHARGIHFLAGAGWLSYTAEDFNYGAPRVMLGTGWSIPVTDDWSVGNRLVWDVAPFGALNNGDTEVADGVRMGLLRFSVFLRSN